MHYFAIIPCLSPGGKDDTKEAYYEPRKSDREDKLTLRSYKVEPAPLPDLNSKLIGDTRKRVRASPENYASTNECWKIGTRTVEAESAGC